jgi:hypothetical protein
LVLANGGWAFRIAGAQTVLASHWKVSDKAASRVGDGVQPALALREAPREGVAGSAFVSACLQTVREADFGPSWHTQCARMAQFQEVAAKAGADKAVLYWVPSVSPAYNWRTAIRYLSGT